MRTNNNDAIIAALAALAQEEGLAPPPAPHRAKKKDFRPSLNPVQGELYDCRAKYILAHSERASGKTLGALHKLVWHCRENKNALAIIITGVKRQAEEGGAWYKLQVEVLPRWKQGCGLEYTDPKTNTAKDVFIWVSNKFGGWSRILLLSMPVEGFVTDRVKGIEPSFILVDEAQTLQSDVYFSAIVQQVGRRPGISTIQQTVYCANPAGPSHWLYHRFFELPVTLYDDGTQEWNDEYAVFHVPIKENLHNLPKGYWENVIEATKNDDTEYRRMVLGEWVDAPTGESIFREDFIDAVHMRGDAIKGNGLLPVKTLPIIEGYDLGAAHSCISFQQLVVTTDRRVWLFIDELNYVDQYVPYRLLVPEILKRREYWNQRMGTQFDWISISDNSAFNQFRATTGSFDVADVEKFSGGKIKLRECPKGPHSVAARVTQTKEKLHGAELFLSAPTCPKTREMFLKLESDKDDRLKPKRSRFLHSFDAGTYPHLYYGSPQRTAPNIQTGEVKPQYYACGR